MKITLKFLKEKDVGDGLIEWKKEHKLRAIDHTKLVELLMKDDRFLWANWLLTRIMTPAMNAKYAKCAAKFAESAEYAEYAKWAGRAASAKKEIIDYGLKLIEEQEK